MNQINRKFSNFFKKKGADKTIYGAVSVLICFGIVMIAGCICSNWNYSYDDFIKKV